MYTATKDINSFAKINEGKAIYNNNDLHRPLYAQALENMEILTLSIITKKIKFQNQL